MGGLEEGAVPPFLNTCIEMEPFSPSEPGRQAFLQAFRGGRAEPEPQQKWLLMAKEEEGPWGIPRSHWLSRR